MKYIRTKDKIIKAKLNKWHELVDKNGKYIAELEIIDQADTIEELCDEFVAPEYTKSVPIWTGENINGLSKKAQYEIIRDYVLENCKTFHPNTIIYGAIWTDKGLIYVAKMNKKGELELL